MNHCCLFHSVQNLLRAHVTTFHQNSLLASYRCVQRNTNLYNHSGLGEKYHKVSNFCGVQIFVDFVHSAYPLNFSHENINPRNCLNSPNHKNLDPRKLPTIQYIPYNRLFSKQKFLQERQNLNFKELNFRRLQISKNFN